MSPFLHFWTLPLISSILTGTWGAAIDQEVLKPANPDHTHLSLSERLDAFYSGLSDLVIDVKPAFSSCYHNPGPFDASQCEAVNASKQIDTWTEDQPGGYFYGNWASCQALGQTCAISITTNTLVPADSKCFDGEVPPRMVNVTSVGDIQRAVRSAALLKLPILVKNTGHDWKGRSSGTNMATIWTHHFRNSSHPPTIEYDFTPVGCSASEYSETVFHFAGGETWGNAYHFADQHNLAVVGGTCPSVGIAGWLQGGGHSPITPIFGMGVDNVRQVEIVLANGSLVTASECQNQELYTAIRGGGGGTWGVLTNITYKAIPKIPIKEFTVSITPSFSADNETMKQFFDIVTAHAPKWAENGWGGYIKTNVEIEMVNANPHLSLDEAKDDMQSLVDFLTNANLTAEVKNTTSWFDYFQKELEPATSHPAGKAGAVASRLIPRTAFDETQRTAFANDLFSLHTNTNISQVWLMLVTPTLYPHTKTSALHQTWASALWSVRIAKLWDPYDDGTGKLPAEANRVHFEGIHNAMEPLRSRFQGMGVSLNEADIWEENAGEAFWGKNEAPLTVTKVEVDPWNLFTNWDAVGWEGPFGGDGRYACYPMPELK